MYLRRIVILFLWPGFGCSKPGEKDTIKPAIIINSPTEGQAFTAGQPIRIAGGVTDNQFIAEIHIHVTNLNTGSLMMDIHDFPNAASAGFDQSFTAGAGINYRIQVLAKDKSANEAISTVNVSCN